MKSKHLITATALALTALATAGPAIAAHQVIYGPRTDVYAASMAHQGPNVAASAYHVVNGAVVPQDTQNGNGGSVSGGGSVSASSVQVSQPGGNGNASFGNSASAGANLANGTLKAATSSYGPENFGSPLGFAQARLDDTVFFTNNTGTTQTISFTYRFDGQLFNPYPDSANPGGNATLMLSCGGNQYGCNNGPNGTGDAIIFAKADGSAALMPNGNALTPFDTGWTYFFDYRNQGTCFGENIYCGQFSSNLWDYGATNSGGAIDGYITAYLNIPTGLTSLGIRGTLNLDCRGGSSCDFGNTGKFGFGDLPSGLSFSSASGVFLSANVTPPTTPPGAVPEPATWAMMIAGFGFIGGMMRVRRRSVAFA